MKLCPYCKDKGYHGEVFISSSGSLCRCLNCERDLDRRELLSPAIKSKEEGKVILCTVHGRKPLEEADINLLAVGKPKGKTYFSLGWEHDPGLAPSRDLVTFTKLHNRKGKLEGWFDRYSEKLIDEWLIRGDSISSFSRLIKYLKEGKTVAISCYCDSVKREFCHLSVLSDIIEDLGFTVEEAEPIKYK